jgi:hypothetical protein
LAYLLSNGEGVFEALHALFQVLDLPLLVGQEEVFDPVHPDLTLVMSSLVVVVLKPSLIISASVDSDDGEPYVSERL